MRLPGATKYRNNGYTKTPGWFWPEDCDLFDRILAQQLADNITGDLLEIGCYHGKSAILMGYGLRDDENLIVCDLFGAPVDTAEKTDVFEASFNIDTFITNYRKFHPRNPVILACSSLELELKQDDEFRFIHVDGGHSYEVAAFDIQTAISYSASHTVIAIDDYRTHHTPGVPAAIWAAAAAGELFPFCLSETKVYAAATRVGHQRWLDVARSWGFPDSEEHTIFGQTVLRTTRGRNCG
jgi:predicted O-methyltransferase YrrM